MSSEYETVIGLEVHVELATKSKIFCGCSTAFGAAPNTHTCPVCLGLPGTLPILNRRVVELACAVGLATNCTIALHSTFDRKNYFYPDNPQNYQISQLYHPLCRDGYVAIETEDGEKRVRIHEIHMEEDAGKLIHDEERGCTFVDYNRAGVPLIEIVSEPDMRSASEVIACLEALRLLIRCLGASDCKLNEGSMRADVNLSVRKAGTAALGTRTEMKNLNSFHAITRAIEHEENRQIALLQSGQTVVQQTRRWDDEKGASFPMRTKEDAQDYRYFPEPDLMPVNVSAEWLEELRAAQPELPEAKKKRYIREFALPAYDAAILTGNKRLSQLFEETVRLSGKPKKVSNWLMGETMRLLREEEAEPEDNAFSPEHLAALIDLLDEGRITGSTAKEVFERIFREDIDPEEYVREHQLSMVSDEAALKDAAARVIAENEKSVRDYHNGKTKALGYLMGQTMKAMQGRADPALLARILKELL